MIKISYINPTGYFSYGKHANIYIANLGITLLDGKNNDRQGGSNGSGKTSLPNALVQIMFGQNPTEWTNDSITNRVLGARWGRVVFEDNSGVLWRITETKKWPKKEAYPDDTADACEIHNLNLKYAGSDLYLDRFDKINSTWVDERATGQSGQSRLTIAATRQKIIDVIGMSYEQFMTVAYLAQQQTIKFISGTHKSRMEVFSHMANLKSWDDRRQRVKERIAEVQTVKREKEQEHYRLQLTSEQEPTQAEYDALDTEERTANTELEDAKTAIKALDDKRKDIDAERAELETKYSETIALLRKLTQEKELINKELAKISIKYQQDASNASNLPKPVELSVIQSELDELRGLINARRYDLEQLLTGSGKCPRCRTNVSLAHIERQRELLKLEIQEAEGKRAKLNEEYQKSVKDWEDEVSANIDKINIEHEAVKALIRQGLDAVNAKSDAATSESESIKKKQAGLETIDQYKYSELVTTKTKCMMRLEAVRSNRNALDAKKKKASVSSTQLAQLATEIAALEKELKLNTLLESMFGDKGVKAFKLDMVIRSLNTILADNISAITDDSVKVRISPFRQKADGDSTTDIQIIVKEGPKDEVPIELYSGGETQQITLALIDAFSQLALLEGGGVNILWLDEIFGPLDQQNASAIFNYLDVMKRKGRSSIFITTHNPDISQQMQFDQVWQVVKTDHTSKIERL